MTHDTPPPAFGDKISDEHNPGEPAIGAAVSLSEWLTGPNNTVIDGSAIDWSKVSIFDPNHSHTFSFAPMGDIGFARMMLFEGKRVRRRGWNGKGMHLELQVPDAHSKMTLPYVFMFTAQGDRVPWLCSQTDLLAADWELAE